MPSVDELIIVFSLNELEFVSFSIEYFPTSYEIYMKFCKSSRFGILGSTPPSAVKKSYRRAVLAIRLWPKESCKTYIPKNLIGNP